MAYHLTRHAEQRILERNITVDDFAAALCYPTRRRKDGKYPTRAHCHVESGTVVVVYRRKVLTVIRMEREQMERLFGV